MMGMFLIKCPTCGAVYYWFSGNLDQRCSACKAKDPPYVPPPVPMTASQAPCLNWPCQLPQGHQRR
jgi:hypothetical protein